MEQTAVLITTSSVANITQPIATLVGPKNPNQATSNMPPAKKSNRKIKVPKKPYAAKKPTQEQQDTIAVDSASEPAAPSPSKPTDPSFKTPATDIMTPIPVPAVKRTKKAATPKTPTAPTRATSRKRRAPERFKPGVPNTSTTTIPQQNAAKKPKTTRTYDPTYITTSINSPLIRADIFHLLLEANSWRGLTVAQQHELVAMLPLTPEHARLIERIDAGVTYDTRPTWFTLSNDCFRTDVAKFQEDLACGHLGARWQASALKAVEKREEGVFDEFKKEQSELWWGQKSEPMY